MTLRRYTWVVTGALCIAWLNSCSLAPEFQRPKIDVPQAYKEDQGKWLQANPKAAEIDRGPWWKIFNDQDLNALEEKIAVSNQDLKAALARYDEARAIAGQAKAGYFPAVNADVGATRQRTSQNIVLLPTNRAYDDFLAGADLSYELDIWGKVRNNVKANEKQATASAADLATMDLSLHAELAMDYFVLRGDDISQVLLDKTVKAYEKALKLTEARFNGGIAPELDVDQAKTQLQTAKTLASDNHLKRAQLEHAIAVLVGEVPSGFTLPVKDNLPPAPQVNAGVPSSLIEQRPDIAAASLRMEAANANIGVARAAYYPDITLNGNAGFESALFPKLFNISSLFWAFGASGAMPLIDGGRINALNSQARAAYDETVANYRQTVLTAYQQVEDNLVALHQLQQEDTSQSAAAVAAKRAQSQVEDRYKGGIATYLDVVVLENTALQSELSEIDVRTRRLTADVLLIKALGGGWQEKALPQLNLPTTPASLLTPTSH